MLKLLLPIVFPSWRFFSAVESSSRIELGFVAEAHERPVVWDLFHVLPPQLDIITSIKQLFHNPHWNELLYMNTCAEHLGENNSVFYAQELGTRLVAAARNKKIMVDATACYLVFRIQRVSMQDETVTSETVFVSTAFELVSAGMKK